MLKKKVLKQLPLQSSTHELHLQPSSSGTIIPKKVAAVMEIFDEAWPFNEWILQNEKFPKNPIDVDEGVQVYCLAQVFEQNVGSEF
jgi:hypothetical protein